MRNPVADFVEEMTVMSNPENLILVVDDEKNIRETTSLLLKASGYKVNTAEDGFDAILQLSRMTPELIIL